MASSPVGFNALSGDLFIKIIEITEYKPSLILALQLTSRGLKNLLDRYEKSISSKFAKPFNGEQITVKSSVAAAFFQPYTFGWLSESYYRYMVYTQIPCHDIFKHGKFYSFVNVARSEEYNARKLEEFKLDMIRMLYDLTDFTAIKAVNDNRGHYALERDFFEQFGDVVLARLATFLDFVSRGYMARELERDDAQPFTATQSAIKKAAYKGLVLYHGPYFIWASVCGTDNEKRWAEDCLRAGVREVLGYDEGAPNYLRLLHEVFSTKANCTLPEVFGRVKDLMAASMS